MTLSFYKNGKTFYQKRRGGFQRGTLPSLIIEVSRTALPRICNYESLKITKYATVLHLFYPNLNFGHREEVQGVFFQDSHREHQLPNRDRW